MTSYKPNGSNYHDHKCSCPNCSGEIPMEIENKLAEKDQAEDSNIRVVDVGTHVVELDLINRCVSIYGDGTRVNLSLGESVLMTKFLSSYLNDFQETKEIDVLEVSTLKSKQDKRNAIKAHAMMLIDRHAWECEQCSLYFKDAYLNDKIKRKKATEEIVSCVARSEGLSPYYNTSLLFHVMLTRYVSDELSKIANARQSDNVRIDYENLNGLDEVVSCNNPDCHETSLSTKICEVCGFCFICSVDHPFC